MIHAPMSRDKENPLLTIRVVVVNPTTTEFMSHAADKSAGIDLFGCCFSRLGDLN